MRRRVIYMVVVTLLATTFFAPCRSASTRREMKKFNEFVHLMDKNYIDSLDYHYLMEVAIKAILDQTDPYSSYLRSGESEDLAAIIESPAIDTTYMVNDSTACVKVSLFSNNTARDILLAYRQMQSPSNLILDLRANKGGLVSEAVRTSNLFLERGVPIFKRNRRGKDVTTHTTQYDGELLTTKVFVVIDRESASASEIVAAALQNNHRALIVGERSFGKALIISPFTLPDGSVVLIATSQYTTPKGARIQRSYRARESSDKDGGITPDIKFNSNELISNDDFIMFAGSIN